MILRQFGRAELDLHRFIWVGLAFLVATCSGAGPSSIPALQPLAQEIILYDWAEDIPQPVLDAFQTEHGVKVIYIPFEASQEAAESIRAGAVYDVVVVENRLIPGLINAGLLAQITPSSVPNFKNISANFRDLVYDPGNQYSIPFNWGTTGLVVRSDLVEKEVRRWSDLWEVGRNVKIALWRGEPRDGLGMALKSLGFSANSERPEELDAALRRLLDIRKQVIFLDDYDVTSSGPVLANGEAVYAVGYALDVLEGQELNASIEYVLPTEGALMWGDNFAIPANSPNKAAAELFINFLLQAEVSAQIANYNRYATPNEAAFPLIEPEILHNPVIFPGREELNSAEIILPLSPEGERMYARAWELFIAGDDAGGLREY